MQAMRVRLRQSPPDTCRTHRVLFSTHEVRPMVGGGSCERRSMGAEAQNFTSYREARLLTRHRNWYWPAFGNCSSFFQRRLWYGSVGECYQYRSAEVQSAIARRGDTNDRFWKQEIRQHHDFSCAGARAKS